MVKIKAVKTVVPKLAFNRRPLLSIALKFVQGGLSVQFRLLATDVCRVPRGESWRGHSSAHADLGTLLGNKDGADLDANIGI